MDTIYRDGFYINIDYGLNVLSSDEIYSNGMALARILISYGWTKNAVAGILGNVHAESGMNPGCSEQPRPWADYLPDNAEVLNSTYDRGMGIVQWTPGRTKIVSWASDEGLTWYDGMTQASRLRYECINGLQMSGNWNYYIHSHDSAADLAEYFLRRYERPSEEEIEQTLPIRRSYGTMWYNRIQAIPDNIILFLATKKRKELKRPCRTI